MTIFIVKCGITISSSESLSSLGAIRSANAVIADGLSSIMFVIESS